MVVQLLPTGKLPVPPLLPEDVLLPPDEEDEPLEDPVLVPEQTQEYGLDWQ